MKRAPILLAAALMLGAAGAAAAAERITGKACVESGNVLQIPCGSATRVRLFASDAPELAQICTRASGTLYDCGEIAAGILRDLIGGRTVSCWTEKDDLYGRPLGLCRAGGTDLNAAMVRRGWALAFRDMSTRYVDLEAEAQGARRGLWEGSFEEPRKWRRATTGREQ